jgi:hypothetical protein
MGAARALSATSWTRGPRLTLLCGAALVAMVVGLLAGSGWSEDGVRRVIRMTACTSLVLFLAAFLASALYRRWPAASTRWLLQNRRYVGLAFATSHVLHLLAILALGRWFPATFARISWVTNVLGGFGFVVVALLAATSSDAAQRALGMPRWRSLHRAGVYYVWMVFTVMYLGESVAQVALLVGALALRLRRG